MFNNGKLRKAKDVLLADKVIQLKNAGKKWEVIALLIQAWAERAPDEVKAQKITIQEYRDNLADPRFGQTKEGKPMERRFILSFPQQLRLMIGTIYKPDEWPMDKKFYTEFAKRFPFFKIPDKL